MTSGGCAGDCWAHAAKKHARRHAKVGMGATLDAEIFATPGLGYLLAFLLKFPSFLLSSNHASHNDERKHTTHTHAKSRRNTPVDT